MPKGVEHTTHSSSWLAPAGVDHPLMPKGVEHPIRAATQSLYSAWTIL